MIRALVLCTLLAGCGIKGDPLPVTRADGPPPAALSAH
ncbi:lipoprotein [Algicella marina]